MSPALPRFRASFPAGALLFALSIIALLPAALHAQQKDNWNAQEQPIFDQIKTLRSLADDERARTTKTLALEIRTLPSSPNKVKLALYLASRATEGDFGNATLREVATTLAEALRQQPQAEENGKPAAAYNELAQLARYEHMQVSLDDPQFAAAMAKLQADDERRQSANFTLTDLQGKTWTLKDLKGKIVLVNFWATWCPPCRKEMPDLDALYQRFRDRGFVILAISEDEETAKVAPYIAEHKISYPILLDPGAKVNDLFQVEGIPKSFVYNREGALVAQSIDMRTQKQFLEMLAQAGLQ